MTQQLETTRASLEPTVLGAAWRRRGLVVFMAVLVGLAAFVFAEGVSAERHEATASIQVVDPRTTVLFETGSRQSTEDYVVDQGEILDSAEIARRAADLMNEAGIQPAVTTRELASAVTIETNPEDSSLIKVTVTLSTPEQATLGADGVIQAYEDLLRDQATASSASSIAVLDASIATLTGQADEIRAQINEVSAIDDPTKVELATRLEVILPRLADLEDQLLAVAPPAPDDLAEIEVVARLEVILPRLAQFQDQLLGPTTEAVREAIRDEIDDFRLILDAISTAAAAQPPAERDESRDEIRDEIADILLVLDAVSSARGLEATDPRLSTLFTSQEQLLSRIDALEERRDGIKLDSQLLGSGVRLKTRAEEATKVTDTTQLTVLGVILGGVLGIVIAYAVSVRRRRFDDRGQPELVLAVPLLAEVPSFKQEGIKTQLPVREAPRSASAEAFRFVAAGLDSKRRPGKAESGGGSTLAVASAKVGEGKTIVAANTALAVARAGKRVLLIDADFGNQVLAELIVPGLRPERGFTEVVQKGIPLSEVVIPVVGAANGAGLVLLARGTRRISAPEFFSLPATRTFLEHVTESFDLVILDTPPLLQVAYASAILGLVDGAILVVPHQGNVADLDRVADRLDLLGTAAVGYVYNLAPLRPEMTATDGSMVDVLGDLP